jgi:hypothetical protein
VFRSYGRKNPTTDAEHMQGFKPGNRHPERHALKGPQIEGTNNVAVKSNGSSSQLTPNF